MRLLDGRQSVRNGDCRSVLSSPIKSSLDDPLPANINYALSFVENKNLVPSDNRTGNSNSLTLAP